MAHKTSFGKRHLNLWSDHPLFLWLMGSSMKTSFFLRPRHSRLKEVGHKTAKKNLEEEKSISLSRSSTIGSTSVTIEERSPSNTRKRSLQELKYPSRRLDFSPSLSTKLAASSSIWSRRIVQKMKHPSEKQRSLDLYDYRGSFNIL
ncbi:MLO-like protein 9 isoform X1 [Iris pallida]|uniref:MLO-like protein 9 isoform X1 n=1 Tax=Iris pallida TaxID=29817 RepID=A0AAX6G0X0_IRIPA|nr:MLO-like protein 9 isoform X1 [Iris pallida]